MKWFVCAWLILAVGAGAMVLPEDTPRAPDEQFLPRSLAPLNDLVGQWNGTGQPRRGSARGAWREQLECFWDFRGTRPTLVLQAEGGKLFRQIEVKTDESKTGIVVTLTDGDGRRHFDSVSVTRDPLRLQAESQDATTGETWRLTVQQINDIRMTLLMERRRTATGSFRRVAGIGYTRDGKRLAVAAANQRICIVTGGRGTIPVMHNGKTWYVCCRGCAQAFQAAPDDYIAKYKAALQKTKQSKADTKK